MDLKCSRCGRIIHYRSCGWCGQDNEMTIEIKKRPGRPKGKKVV